MAILASGCLCLVNPAQAANHALIMTIDYNGTPNYLPGIDKDGEMAVTIAKSMGVPGQNIQRMSNHGLTLTGMRDALLNFKNSIADGDKVFLYYSGHGYQSSGTDNKCTESLVTSDLKFFEDVQLKASMEDLAAKASQVVMFNDSCFSGGAATKNLPHASKDAVPKVYVNAAHKSGSAADADYVCGGAVNKEFGFRALGVVARKQIQTLYVAASADNEISFASPSGSWATQAWASCLTGGSADRDGNGIVDGKELQTCSQAFINNRFKKQQTITFVGNEALPMSFVGSTRDGASTPVTNSNRTLETLRAAADSGFPVSLSITSPRLTIGRDLLDFSVTTQQAGYLYLLHVASDGKFYVLFPNQIDQNNYIGAGTHRFPRPKWAIAAQGPVGTSYIMAYLTDSAKDFGKNFDVEGPFAVDNANSDIARKLGVVARYGASTVEAIEEVK